MKLIQKANALWTLSYLQRCRFLHFLQHSVRCFSVAAAIWLAPSVNVILPSRESILSSLIHLIELQFLYAPSLVCLATYHAFCAIFIKFMIIFMFVQFVCCLTFEMKPNSERLKLRRCSAVFGGHTATTNDVCDM